MSIRKLRKMVIAAVLALIFCGLCAQKFWRERTFFGKSPRIKDKKKEKGLHPVMERFLCPKLREDQIKKRSSARIGASFSARKFVCCLSYYCNFMINNITSVQQYICAQQTYVCAQSLKSVCARTD